MTKQLGIVLFCIGILAMAALLPSVDRTQLLSPVPAIVVRAGRPVPGIDTWVDVFALKFAKSKAQYGLIKARAHCLLYKETGYGSNKGFGDGGKAGGILQFHEPTYIGFRKIMMAQGLVKEIGSRMNQKDAIETTMWAIANGRELNWGPVLRKECL